MQAQRMGMLSLRLDALYCLILGTAVAIASPAISTVIALPAPVILAAGAAVVLWAGLVEWMRAKLHLRIALRIVMSANFAATLVVAAVSLTAAAMLAVLVVATVAIDIALFAGSQALALGRLRMQAT